MSDGGPTGRQCYLTRTDVDQEAKLRHFTPHDELDKWKRTDFQRTDQYVFPSQAAQLKKWVEGGAKAGLGSHGEVQGLGTHWEAGANTYKPYPAGIVFHAVIDAALGTVL